MPGKKTTDHFNTVNPATLFAWFGIGLGLLYCFLTPAFRLPDEFRHFAKAYRLSEGIVSAEIRLDENGRKVSGGQIPISFKTLAEFLNYKTPLRYKPHSNWRDISEALEIPLNETQKEYTDFRNTSVFHPLCYLPQAIAIFLARQFDLPALAALYAARLSTLIVTGLITYLALRILPVGNWALLLVQLLPISMFCRVNVGPDALAISTVLLLTAIVTKRIASESYSYSSYIRHLLLLGPFVASAKHAYSYSLLLSLFPRTKCFQSMRNLSGMVFILFLSCFSLGIWVIYSKPFYVPIGAADSNPEAQLRLILENPIPFFELVLDLYRSILSLPYPFFTGPVFFELPFSMPLQYAGSEIFVISLAALCLSENISAPKLEPLERFFMLLLLLCGMISIVFFAYLGWGAVGGKTIDYIIPRYFLPLAPFLVLAIIVRKELLSSQSIFAVIFLAGVMPNIFHLLYFAKWLNG